MSGPLTDLGARIAQVSDIYAGHYGIDRSGDWHLLKLQEEMGELTQAYLDASGRSRRPADDKKSAPHLMVRIRRSRRLSP